MSHTIKIGKRAAEYVNEHGRQWRENGPTMVADMLDTPPGIARTLTRVFGRPETIDRGEVAYWRIDGEVAS